MTRQNIAHNRPVSPLKRCQGYFLPRHIMKERREKKMPWLNLGFNQWLGWLHFLGKNLRATFWGGGGRDQDRNSSGKYPTWHGPCLAVGWEGFVFCFEIKYIFLVLSPPLRSDKSSRTGPVQECSCSAPFLRHLTNIPNDPTSQSAHKAALS